MTIAFNRPDMIEYQNLFLRKHFKCPYILTVVDNSTLPKARSTIRSYCVNQNIPYLSLPPNPFRSPQFSNSHGSALNYTYKNYLKHRAASIIGFLDHDIFPVDDFNIQEILSTQPFYGMLQENETSAVPNGKLLYLWPGLAFFLNKNILKKKLDFMPNFGGDTGSASYYSIYKPTFDSLKSGETFQYAEEERIKLLEGSNFQTDMFAMIGKKWLHVVNASEWKKSENNIQKEFHIKQLLETLLKK